MKHHSEQRFSGDLAEEYELITLAYPEFEAFQKRMIHRVDEAIIEAQGNRTHAAEPLRVLEIGTGNGFTTRMLVELATSRSANRGSRVVITSVDNDPEMLGQAREHINSPLCTLIEADALAFLQDQLDDSWDVVTSAFTIHNLEQEYREAVEKEIHRTLRSGGLFSNADKYAPDGQERFEALNYQVGRFFDAFLASGKTELLRKWVLHNIDDQSPRYVMLASEAIPRLTALGFDNVTLEARAQMQAVVSAWKP